MANDDSSMILAFDTVCRRPETARVCEDAQLLDLSHDAAKSMAKIMQRFQVSTDGAAMWNPPHPHEAGEALRGWLRSIGEAIDEHKRQANVEAAVRPLPRHTDPDEVRGFFTGKRMPSMRLLMHILWGIGIGPHAITGAALLHHRASNPVKEHDTSDLRRAVAKVV